MKNVELKKLNKNQEKIANQRTGHQIVTAGAGSGKTMTLVEQFGRCIKNDKAPLESLVSITFTEKAASKLKQDIREWLLKEGEKEAANNIEMGNISTIHSFCTRLLKEHSLLLGIDPAFSVIDEIKANILKRDAMDMAIEKFTFALSSKKLRFAMLYGLRNDNKMKGSIIKLYDGIRGKGISDISLPGLKRPSVKRSYISMLVPLLLDATSDEIKESQNNEEVIREMERFEEAIDIFCKPDFDIFDYSVSEFAELIKNKGNIGVKLRDIKKEINAVKSEIISQLANYHAFDDYLHIKELLGLFAKHYQNLKTEIGCLDFEDLQIHTCKLLENNSVCEKLKKEIRLFQIDEFQDTNYLQAKILKQISPENICLVGDKNQSIYGFRDADIKLFENICASYPIVNKLDTNYRSNKKILDFLNYFFGGSSILGNGFLVLEKDKDRPEKKDPAHGKIEIIAIEHNDESNGKKFSVGEIRKTEAEILASRILDIVSEGAADFKDIAIIMRQLTGLQVFEDALQDRQIPYYLYSGRYYFQKSEIKDINNYLKILANPLDRLSFAAVLKSPFARLSDDALYVLSALDDKNRSFHDTVSEVSENGSELIDEEDAAKIKRFAADFKKLQEASGITTISQLIEEIISVTDYDLTILSKPVQSTSVFANIRKLIREASSYEQLHGSDIRGFTNYIDEAGFIGTKEGGAPTMGEKENAVKIMTVHAAKGLDFKAVFVVDLNKKFEPTQKNSGFEIIYSGDDSKPFRGFGFKWRESWDSGLEAFDYAVCKKEKNAAETEEEKRLFYVAASRAEERLYFVGGADFKKVGTPKANILETVLSHLDFDEDLLKSNGAATAKASNAEIDISYCHPGNLDISNKKVSGISHEITDYTKLELMPDKYQSGIPSPVSRLSASSLKVFMDCRYKFFLKHIAKTKEFPKNTATSATKNISMSDYGNVAHKFISTIEWKNFKMPPIEDIKQFVDANIIAGKQEIEDAAGKLSSQIERLANSAIGKELTDAKSVKKEIPFSFILGGIVFEGYIDALADKTTIIDFKTGMPPSKNQKISNGLDLQADLYSLAVLKHGAETAVSKLVFLDTPGEPIIKKYAQKDIPALEEHFNNLVHDIKLSDYKANAAFDNLICPGCPVYKIGCFANSH